MRVERLCLYPVKSCGGLEVPEFQIGEAGPQIQIGSRTLGDREWMFVDASGKFLTQRTQTRMAKIKTSVRESKVFLSVEGGDYEVPWPDGRSRMQVSVWGKEINAARVEGGFNQAVSEFLGSPVQLVKFDDLSDREALLKGRGLGVQTRFTDSQPYLVVTLESLEELNSRMKNPIPADRFRANIVLKGSVKGFAEDQWQVLGSDQLVFESTKDCARCKVITVDQDSGEIPDSEPLKALTQFRKRETAVYFGRYFLSRSFGEILKIGDSLEAGI